MPTINLTADDVYTALRAFILSVIDVDVGNVIQGLGNGAATPSLGFIAMTMLFSTRLATNSHSYTDDSQTITKPHDVVIQIDCYGSQSFEWATVLSTLLRDEYATSRFNADIQPLHADDPKQMVLINAEQQYEERWMIEAHFQVNSAITTTIETANTLGDVSLYPVL